MPRIGQSVNVHGKRNFAVVMKDHIKLERKSCTVLTTWAQCNHETGERVTVRKADVATEAKFRDMNFEDGGRDLSQRMQAACRKAGK